MDLHIKQKRKAEKLLPKFIKRDTIVSKEEFSQFLRDYPELDPKGIKRSMLNKMAENLAGIIEKCSNEADEPSPQAMAENQRTIAKCENYLELSQILLDLRNGIIDRVPTRNSRSNDKLCNKEWHFYFLHITEGTEKRAELCRSILVTKENCTATIEKAESGIKHAYNGTYEILSHNHHVAYFNFLNDQGDRQLQLKILFDTADDDIILGSFTTFDEKRLSSCRVLLQKINDEVPRKSAVVMSFRRAKDELDDVELEIKRYLGIKKHNYQVVPKYDHGIITNLNELNKFVSNTQPFDDRENYFLELDRPRVFIGSPQGSHDNSSGVDSDGHQIDEIVRKIKLNIEEELGVDVIYKTSTSTRSVKSSLENLKGIRRTRFFVLILTGETRKASFSLVQLGWALAHCKHILIICEKDTISRRFMDMKHNLGIQILEHHPLSIENAVTDVEKFVRGNILLESDGFAD